MIIKTYDTYIAEFGKDNSIGSIFEFIYERIKDNPVIKAIASFVKAIRSSVSYISTSIGNLFGNIVDSIVSFKEQILDSFDSYVIVITS